MSTRDRRSQRIRDQLRAHPNPRSRQQGSLPRTLQTELKRVYAGEHSDTGPQEPLSVAAELARLARRRR